MGKIFGLESPFMRFMDTLTNLIILNLVVIVLCLPIFTAGAAFSALHHVVYLMVHGEEGYILKDFGKAFMQNFKQSTLCWLIVLFMVFILGGDYVAMYQADPGHYSLLFQVVIWIISVLASIGIIYIFPVTARYENSIKNTFKSAYALGFYGIFRTLAMIVITALPWVLTALFQYFGIFAALIGFSLPAYICVYLYRPVFRHFEKKKEGGAQ